MASVAAAARITYRRTDPDPRRLPGPRAAKLDPQLWSVRARHRARHPGAADRRAVRRGESEVRVMSEQTFFSATFGYSAVKRGRNVVWVFACWLCLTLNAFAAT